MDAAGVRCMCEHERGGGWDCLLGAREIDARSYLYSIIGGALLCGARADETIIEVVRIED